MLESPGMVFLISTHVGSFGVYIKEKPPGVTIELESQDRPYSMPHITLNMQTGFLGITINNDFKTTTNVKHRKYVRF